MDTSETVWGTRERAPEERLADSANPARSMGKKCRAGDPHLALIADEEVVKEHAQARHSEATGEIDAQSTKDLEAPHAIGGGGRFSLRVSPKSATAFWGGD